MCPLRLCDLCPSERPDLPSRPQTSILPTSINGILPSHYFQCIRYSIDIIDPISILPSHLTFILLPYRTKSGIYTCAFSLDFSLSFIYIYIYMCVCLWVGVPVCQCICASCLPPCVFLCKRASVSICVCMCPRVPVFPSVCLRWSVSQ